jgi:2-C-methyl-D-erythritol 2,4-cyclodiphosphate synthase
MPAKKENLRIGLGYDAHRLAKGRRLILGGVEIPFKLGLLGHSDADVLCHAIADSLLGAAAAGDIGRHFPDSDPKLKGISSLLLLASTKTLLRKAGYRIINIDSTVVAEAPRLSPHAVQMRQNIARALGVRLAQVSVKATTNERLGAVGRGQGIYAFAQALIRKDR